MAIAVVEVMEVMQLEVDEVDVDEEECAKRWPRE